MDNATKAADLTKYYGNLCAVDHVNFEVKKGEVFGYLGPNGVGKTTTIRMLTGISIPTEGKAAIMGYDIQRNPVEAKEQMGIVPDVSNVYTELSAWDNLIFTGKLYDMPKVSRKSRAEELLKMFGLYERRREKVQPLSRGMKRRICIAMALMNRSGILFLDEPTSGLDVQSVIIIRDLIRKLNQQGLTIFPTTHNIEEARAEKDIDISTNKPKLLTTTMAEGADKITTMGCSVEKICPAPLLKNVIDWNLEDPKGKPIEKVRQIRDEIEKRVLKLVSELGD